MEFLENEELFQSGGIFPPISHQPRIERYRYNKKLFKGEHLEQHKTLQNYNYSTYLAVALPSLIVKKSADFLFGESVKVLSGKGESSNEQKALDRFMEDNHMNILLYESALSNAYCGDSFIKVRYGQPSGGVLPAELDPARVIIENLNAEYVYPQFSRYDKSKIDVFHYAVPFFALEEKKWYLNVESHSAGQILYTKYQLSPLNYDHNGEITTFSIGSQVGNPQLVYTGVSIPLIVHIPNFSTSDTYEGLDDLSAMHDLFSELNNRMSQIAYVLDCHANPALAVAEGTLSDVDEDGNPNFRVAVDKVFEVASGEIVPQYITYGGSLQEAFTALDKTIKLILSIAEIPPLAVGMTDGQGGGTSGASGIAVKFQLNSLLSKVNRKRQFYEKGLKQILYIAQKLEEIVGVADYETVIPLLQFSDGLPADEMEQSQIYQLRTSAKLQSRKSAIMALHGMTEEQAEIELQRIKDEEMADMEVASPSIFNFEEEAGE